MIIYLDTDYKCHVDAADGLTAIETDAFDGACKTYIEGCRFIPNGSVWTRDDGNVFRGEMVTPWKPHSNLLAAQEQYEADFTEMKDMQDALEILGVTKE